MQRQMQQDSNPRRLSIRRSGKCESTTVGDNTTHMQLISTNALSERNNRSTHMQLSSTNTLSERNNRLRTCSDVHMKRISGAQIESKCKW